MSTADRLSRIGRQRPGILTTAVLFLLLLVTAILLGSPATETALDLDSAGPDGLLGFRLWLEEMGYNVTRSDDDEFALSPEADLLFVYPNIEPYSRLEAQMLHDWVAEGHTLVLIGAGADDLNLTGQFGYDLGLNRASTRLKQNQPLLPEVEPEVPYLSFGRALVVEDTAGAVPVLVSDDGNVLAAVRSVGDGTVWYLDGQLDFTNAQLKAGALGQLAPPLLRHVPERGTIIFDTYHLFARTANDGPASLRDWLTQTGQGRALLFAGALILVYILLSGWRLGPPLKLAPEDRRREAGEHVAAMAALQQRARHRQMIARHHKWRLKVGLGRSYHINPELPDALFVEHLVQAGTSAASGPADDAAILLRALDEVKDEEMLVRAVSQVDQLLGRTPARQSVRKSYDTP